MWLWHRIALFSFSVAIAVSLTGNRIFKGFLIIATDKLDGTIGQFLGTFDSDLSRDPVTKKTCTGQVSRLI